MNCQDYKLEAEAEQPTNRKVDDTRPEVTQRTPGTNKPTEKRAQMFWCID